MLSSFQEVARALLNHFVSVPMPWFQTGCVIYQITDIIISEKLRHGYYGGVQFETTYGSGSPGKTNSNTSRPPPEALAVNGVGGTLEYSPSEKERKEVTARESSVLVEKKQGKRHTRM